MPCVIHIHIIIHAGIHVNIVDHVNINTCIHMVIRVLCMCAQQYSYDLYYAYYYSPFFVIRNIRPST